jgi:hypothetical protein
MLMVLSKYRLRLVRAHLYIASDVCVLNRGLHPLAEGLPRAFASRSYRAHVHHASSDNREVR